MADLSYLFSGSPPPAVTTGGVSTNGLPEWYQEYLRGTAGKAVELAGQSGSNPVPQQAVAGFSPDQLAAFQGVRNNQGVWQPYLNSAAAATGAMAPTVGGMVGQAQQAVSGPAATFPANFQQYMSPYTMGVVNEIGRLGNLNFEENIMPAVNRAMTGAGQFGSTRNAEMLGRAARNTQLGITGQQAQALEAGYGTSANIFGQDAARQQQQQQMQGSAALQGASTMGNALSTSAQQFGALGQGFSALGLADAQALGAAGKEQQALNQAGYDTAYNNQVLGNQYDWSTLNNMNSILRGVQLPATQTQLMNGPAQVYQPGALQTIGQTYGWMRGTQPQQ